MSEEEELFAQSNEAMSRWAQTLEHPDHPDCTGLGADYCQVHGTCTCPRDEFSADRTGEESPACPLHGSDPLSAAIARVPSMTIGSGILCEHCEAEMDQDQKDLSQIRFRRQLCRSCFDVVRKGGTLRPNPTRKTY